MSAVTITQMADRVSSLMEERLGARGRDLDEKVRRAGRRLPRRVRLAARSLADAALMAQNPKLLIRVDEADVAAQYDICLRHLGPLNRAERRKGYLMNLAASVAFSVLMVGVAVLAFLVWRDYV